MGNENAILANHERQQERCLFCDEEKKELQRQLAEKDRLIASLTQQKQIMEERLGIGRSGFCHFC